MANKTGTTGNDTLTGTASADQLFGLAGNDSLLGLDGNDRLEGGGGNDTLNGGIGIDTLIGGSGNDSYIVDNTADTVTEAANSGIDTVQSSISYTLGSNQENLRLTRAGTINGTGNSLNNIIIGNGNSNTLRGAAGNDTLTGSTANVTGDMDTLTGGSGEDLFTLGDETTFFYDDRNPTTAGRSDYALITDFNTNSDIIQLQGTKNDYILDPSPSGLPAGTAIYRDKPSSEPNELIAIVQSRTGLSLDSDYFSFKLAEFSLAELNGRNGFVLNGNTANNVLGASVRSAGDVNGDGFEDIIIGSPGIYETGFENRGKAYVVFGRAGGFSTNLNVSDLNGRNGFVLNGAYDGTGSSVSAADINGDGFSDLLIGTVSGGRYTQPEASGYVVFGKAEGFAPSLNLSNLNGDNGFAFNTIGSDSFSTIGDINADGFEDIMIRDYVVFGKAESFDARFNFGNINGQNGFSILGISNAISDTGISVNAAGDINGDGFDDIAIGAIYSGAYTGKSYVVFGKEGNFDASFNVSQLDGSNGFVLNGVDERDTSGASVSSAGDINGDGFDDLIIGAPGANANSPYSVGESYVVFGKAEGFAASLNPSDLNGSNGFKINGIDPGDGSGSSVSSAGDVNGDGFDDILIGATGADPNGQSSAGESYVVFGRTEGFGASFNLSELNSNNGLVIKGIDAGDGAGRVSNAGDVNGDGFNDLLVGAPRADVNGQYSAGSSYVIFGRDFTDKVTNAGTVGNDTLTGTAGDDVLIGGLGNDRLIGGTGIDVLIGGAGNDTLSFGAIDRRLDGGSGIDTLRIDGSDNIDLTTIANNKFTAFEIIDITGTGNNSLAFTRLDVLDLSDTTNRLIVNGNAGDKVTSTGQGWAFGGTTTVDNILYRQYTTGAATLLVDADITQTIS